MEKTSTETTASIPAVVPNSIQPPTPTTENKPVEQKSDISSKSKTAKATVRFGVPGAGFPFSIQQAPLTGQEGFAIKGSFGLSGTITRPDPSKDLWVFAGQFELPSEDYEIGEIGFDILNAPVEYYTQKQPLPPSFIPHVMITIQIKLPPNPKDEKGNFKVPFRLEIPVSAKAQFNLIMTDKR
ncbi:MAG TPA: hypothetical protein PLX23_07545 [Candidatus Hydrogenedens sp.]|nr:hypothetical protein [Candidatus Hydrogenedens sp.]